MPGMDGTGPLGNGPIGRGMGPCFGEQGGRGRGFGFNRWNRPGWNAAFSTLNQGVGKEILEQQKVRLESELALISKKLQEQKDNENS